MSLLPYLAPLVCRYAAVCSGCAWIEVPYDQQAARKIDAFKTIWQARNADFQLPEIKYRAIASGGLRDRADLVFDSREGEPRLGLFDREHKNIIDLEVCPQLSPPLQKWLKEFRTLKFPIGRGSVRLRVSPRGEKGAWLDFANVEVKMLLDEEVTLRRLLAMDAFVEIGQRRKQLIERDGQLKLGDAVGRPWFETYVSGQPRELLTSVGNFTQPGFQANRVLIETAMEALKPLNPKRVVEFGSGVGNFTLPLASVADHVDAYEIDALASQHLQDALDRAGLANKVHIHIGDFQNLSVKRQVSFEHVDLVVVDPPRSGLKNFLTPLIAAPIKPKALLYISCFAESFITDAAHLLKAGYICQQLTIVDQFPQTPHAELIALFQLM